MQRSIKIYRRQPYDFDPIALQESYGFADVVTLTGNDPDGCPVFIFGERDATLSLKAYHGGYLGPKSNIRNCDGSVDHITYGSLTPLSYTKGH